MILEISVFKTKSKCWKVRDFTSFVLTRISSVEALWCSGSDSGLTIRGSVVRIPLGAYALRQGILSIIVSLDPGEVNGYRQEFIPCLPCALV